MQLRLVTYNIHRAIGLDRRFRPARIAEVLAHHDADLVLLQEVDEGVPRSRELDLAREIADAAGYPFHAVGHNVTLRKGRYGNATLSRLPILRERNIDLTIAGKKRRGCQHTTLEVPGDGGRLEVFNLHLGLSGRERERQVGLLVRSPELRELSPAAPCLVAGDFNDWRSRLRVVFTEILEFSCATDRADGERQRAVRTYPAVSPRGGLDRIYYRGPMELRAVSACRLRLSRRASDHLPVIAEFELAG